MKKVLIEKDSYFDSVFLMLTTKTVKETNGVVEAVGSTDQAFVIGVQWHPELLFREAASHHCLFAGLVEACVNRE